jgi:hypothetical protein
MIKETEILSFLIISIDINIVFTESEQEAIKANLDNSISTTATSYLYLHLRKILSTSLWLSDKQLVASLKEPLLRSCAWYLYREKRRNHCLNSVGKLPYRLKKLINTNVIIIIL